MKRIVSLMISIILAMSSVNLVLADELQPISGTAEKGKYIWNFNSGSASAVYDCTDEYAALRVSTGAGDSISTEKGIYFANPSCNEPPTSAKDSGRYILIKPTYSGTVNLTVAFSGAGNSAKCRIWYNDFEEMEFDEVDTSLLIKGYADKGKQLGSDITSDTANDLSFSVTGGHTYSLHTYNRGSYITSLNYESDEIVGKTTTPTINTPITSDDTSISGTCEDGAAVFVTINGGEEKQATVDGTEWTLENLTLNADDTISVTAQLDGEKKSDTATATVLASENIFSLIIDENIANGYIKANVEDTSKIEKDSNVTITAVPNDGYKLKSLTVDGQTVETKNNSYSFTITKNTEVTAEFEQLVYHNITINSAANGTVTADSDKALEDDVVTLTVSADKDYRIKSLKYKSNDEEKEIKYEKKFVMPTSDVEITPVFDTLNVVSEIDTSLEKNDRITMNVDGTPFFFNGIQIRADKVIDSWGFTDEQVKAMFKQAADDGFTVANTQIRWMDIQPDKKYNATKAVYVNGNDSVQNNSTLFVQKDESVAYMQFETPDTDTKYAGAKIRVYVNEVNGNGSLHIYGIDNNDWDTESMAWDNAPCKNGYEITGTDCHTTASWDTVNKTAYYDIDVTDFINSRTDKKVGFAVCADNDVKVGINNGTDTTHNVPQLVLSSREDYDWTYLDKMISYSEDAGIKLEILWFAIDTCQQSADSRVPYYILNNYQKTLAPDLTPIRQRGDSYSFLMCKEDEGLRAKEQEVVETIFNHIAEYDKKHGGKKTVVGCQITNEPAVARMHGGDYKYNERCYCDKCQAKYDKFIADGKTKQDYLNDVMWNYQNSIAEAIKQSDYSVWTRTNNYGGTDANIVEYNEKMRQTENGTSIDFIGYDPYTDDTSFLYNYGHGTTQMTKVSVNYTQGKNLPMIMENGGGAKGSTKYQNAPALTLAALAGGSFYNVYELCGPDELGMYLEKTYPLTQRGDYVESVRKTNKMLNKIAYVLASKNADGADGDELMFFNSLSNDTKTTKKMVRAIPVVYNTDNNGVGIAAEINSKEIVLESTSESEFVLQDAKLYGIRSVETGEYNGTEWVKTGEKEYTENGNDIVIETSEYDCIRVLTKNEIPSGEEYSPEYTYNAETNEYTYDFSLFANSTSLAKTRKMSNLKIYGTSDDSINPTSAIYKTTNGNETSEGGIWWNGKTVDSNRYMEYTAEKNGTLTIRLRNTYNKGNKAKSWLRYGTVGVEKDYIAASDDLYSQEYQIFSVELEKGKTYYFWPVGSGVNISSLVFKAEKTTYDNIMSYDENNNTVTSAVSGDMIVAKYNDNGVLSDVKVHSVKADESVKIEESGKYKVMLWESLSGMNPIAQPKEFTVKSQYIIKKADSDSTVIDTSSMVESENITGYLVTSAKDGIIISTNTVPVQKSITVNTESGADIEVAPIYEYKETKSYKDGVTLDESFADGLYNITFTNGSTAHVDLYVNGYMAANNVDQDGYGRSVSSGSTYTANDIKVSGGKITLKTADTSDGTLAYVKIVKAPSVVERKTKIYVMGDSLVANYYGGNEDNYLGTTQTGWGQVLKNYINTDKYEVVNLANAGYYASNLYTTAFPSILYNSREGDVFIFESGVNDYYQPNSEEGGESNKDNMKKYALKIAEEAKNAGLKTVLVNPNVTPSKCTSPMLFGQVMIDTAKDANVEYIDLTQKSYDFINGIYGDNMELIKKNVGLTKSSDNTHSSYLGAMKYASIVAGELYNLGYTDMINTEFSYTKNDTEGNTIVCKAIK